MNFRRDELENGPPCYSATDVVPRKAADCGKHVSTRIRELPPLPQEIRMVVVDVRPWTVSEGLVVSFFLFLGRFLAGGQDKLLHPAEKFGEFPGFQKLLRIKI